MWSRLSQHLSRLLPFGGIGQGPSPIDGRRNPQMDERVADGAAGVGGPVQGAPFAPLHLVPDVGIEDIGQADRARHRKGADQAVVFDVGGGLDNLQRLIPQPDRLLFDCSSAGENGIRCPSAGDKQHEADQVCDQ